MARWAFACLVLACKSDVGSGPDDSTAVPPPPVVATPVWRVVDSIWSGGIGQLVAESGRPPAVDSVSLGGAPMPFRYDAESGSLDLFVPAGTHGGATRVDIASGASRSSVDVTVSVPTPTASETRQLESLVSLWRASMPSWRNRAASVGVEADMPTLFDEVDGDLDSLTVALELLATLTSAQRDTVAVTFRSYGHPTLLARLMARLSASVDAPRSIPQTQSNASSPQAVGGFRYRPGIYSRDQCTLDPVTEIMGDLGEALSLRNTLLEVETANLRPGSVNPTALVRANNSLVIANIVAWMFETDAKMQFAKLIVPLPPGEGGALTFVPSPLPTTDVATLRPYVRVRRRGVPWEVFKEQVASVTIEKLLETITGAWTESRKHLGEVQQALLASAPTLTAALGSYSYDRMVDRTNSEIARVDRQRPSPTEPFVMRWDGPISVMPSTSTEWTLSTAAAMPLFQLSKPVTSEKVWVFSTTDASGSAVVDECDPQVASTPPEPFGRVYANPDGKRIGLSTEQQVELKQGAVTDVPVTVTNPWPYPVEVDLELLGATPAGVTAVLREQFLSLPANAQKKVSLRYIVQNGTRDAASPASLGIGVLARIGNVMTRCAVAPYGIDDIAFGYTQSDHIRVKITGARKNEAIRVEFGTLVAGTRSARSPQGVQALQEGENSVSIRLNQGRSFAYVRAVVGSGSHIRYEFSTEGITNYDGDPMVNLGSAILSAMSDAHAKSYFRQRTPPVRSDLRGLARRMCEEFNGVGR